MDYHKLLEDQAAQLQLPLTPLADLHRCEQACKIACCGGVVMKIVSESACDSTVALRDDGSSSNSSTTTAATCFCAIHGDVASTYPDVLTVGALLLLRNATLLVTGAKMPPLLIACLGNIAGLMLPEDDAATAAPPPLPPPPPELRASPLRLQRTLSASSPSLLRSPPAATASLGESSSNTTTTTRLSAWHTSTPRCHDDDDDDINNAAGWTASVQGTPHRLTAPRACHDNDNDNTNGDARLPSWQQQQQPSLCAASDVYGRCDERTAATAPAMGRASVDTTTPHAQRVRVMPSLSQQPPVLPQQSAVAAYDVPYGNNDANNNDANADDDDDCLELADDDA